MSWDVSPVVNGRLRLRSNAMSLVHETGKGSSFGRGFNEPALVGWLPATSDSRISRSVVSATNQARARFMGKLHKGGASLGVTIASARQSIDMVRNRAQSAVRQIAALEHRARVIGYDPTGLSGRARRRSSRRYEYSSRRVKRVKESIASAYLEVVFGWQPLLADIHSSLNTVCQQAIPPACVSGRGKASFSFDYSTRNPNGPANQYSIKGDVSVTISAMVSISNPNLWLANRLGVINPAVVAWDLVPWSFVVNMFANVNQVLGALTDTAGLAFGNESTTTTVTTTGQSFTFNGYPQDHPFFGGGSASTVRKNKSRGIGGIPPPQLELRVPDLDAGLAAIAVSLLVQRSKRLANFLSL